MSIKISISSIFMVPTLKIKRENLTDNGFINAYLSDSRRDVQHRNAVYLLFKPDNLDKFREFLDAEYERTTYVLDDYDYEGGYVVIVYQLNPMWREDFMLVREGMYSKTSASFQKDFPKVIKIMKNGLHRDEISLQYRIFNKTLDLKEYWENKLDISFTEDMEVWDGFDIAKETLDLDNVKEKQLI